nr:E5 GAMMA [human papillomavirus 74]WAB53909.1 E5 GAMMA [human papillomavirus 74]WAB54246.1 E5 GAMMA [human papillomavirus 74]
MELIPIDGTIGTTSTSLLPVVIAVIVCFVSIVLIIYITDFIVYTSILVLTLILYLLLWLLLTSALQFYILTLCVCFFPAWSLHSYIVQNLE